MWILKWLPDWIFYAILMLGIFGLISTYLVKFIAKFVPPLYVYKTPIQIASIAMIVFGVFMTGAIYNNEQWEARVKELEAKVQVAEQKSQQVNTEIVEKLVTKTKVIREKGQEVTKYIDREVVKYDTKFLPGGECEIPKEFIQSLNKSAETPK
ncbi:MAG: hypothetical protein EBU90_10195 [Proteobacteria bacterium]|nr:hypothetical protein [Pseudomonadota bacterium]